MTAKDMVSYNDALLVFRSFEFVNLEVRTGLLSSIFYEDPVQVYKDLSEER